MVSWADTLVRLGRPCLRFLPRCRFISLEADAVDTAILVSFFIFKVFVLMIASADRQTGPLALSTGDLKSFLYPEVQIP